MTTTVLLGDVRTMASRGSAEAIAYRDGAILAVGTREDVIAAAGDGARTIHLGGATVLPGFVDAHHHASLVALYGGTVRLVSPAVVDIPSLQRALAEAARTTRAEWIVATDWDEALLAERRAPTREELDAAVPDRPVVAIHYSCHRAVASTRALEAVGIGASTPDPSGGTIGRGKGGLPNGLLVERAMSAVERRARETLLATDGEGFLTRLGEHYLRLAAVGVTRVVDATVHRRLLKNSRRPSAAASARASLRSCGACSPTRVGSARSSDRRLALAARTTDGLGPFFSSLRATCSRRTTRPIGAASSRCRR